MVRNMKQLAHRLGRAWIWVLLVTAQVLWLFYWNRWILDIKFDRNALTDLYDHSQWVVPMSPRIMADAELYQLAGDLLLRTGEMFRINPETPPVGKYLYGLAIQTTQRPYLASIGLFLTALLLTGILAFLISPRGMRRQVVAITTSLLLANQLFSSQLSQTMLDIPQLIGLLLYILGLIAYKKTTKMATILLAGVGLGIFAGSKIGILAPILPIGGVFFLSWRRWKQWLLIFASAGVFYLALYVPFFWQGNTLLDWFGAQKWMVTFYRSSGVAPHYLNLPATLLTGSHWGWWNEHWSAVQEWSTLWPLMFGAFLLHWKRWKNLDNTWQGILVIGSLLLASFVIFPFWPRYLILVLPFAAIFLARFIQPLPLTHQLTAGMGLLLLTITSQLSSPTSLAAHLADRWSAKAYPEMYQLLDDQSRQELTLGEFITLVANAEHGLQSKKITAYAQLEANNLWPTKQQGTLYLVRETPIGLFTHSQALDLIRERGRWRIRWNPQLIAPNFEPGSSFMLMREEETIGSVKTEDDIEIIRSGTQEILFVDPEEIENNEEDINALATLTGMLGTDLRHAIFVTSYRAPWVRLGPLVADLQPEEIQAAKQKKGYFWSEEVAPFILEDLQGVPYSLWMRKFLSEHPEIQPVASGVIILNLPNGNTQVLKETPGKAGQDILLPYTYDELKEAIRKEMQ